MAKPTDATLRRVYLDTVKRLVMNYAYLGGIHSLQDFNAFHHYDVGNSAWTIEPLSRPLTLLSDDQLDLIEIITLDLAARQVPGDYIEAGIWRGGVVVFMRALLVANGISDRKVFGADSFAGIPRNTKFRHDPVDAWPDRWVATFEEVSANVARLGFLDERTVLIPGLFAESLPALAGERFSLIRLDSDAFDSVAGSLDHLYPLLSLGGVIVIDDWHLVPCQMAVGLYRDRHGIDDPVHVRAGNAYWVKRQQYGYPDMTRASLDLATAHRTDGNN